MAPDTRIFSLQYEDVLSGVVVQGNPATVITELSTEE